MDLAEHARARDQDVRVPLVDGGRLDPRQDVRSPRIARRLPDHQLQDGPQAAMVAACR